MFSPGRGEKRAVLGGQRSGGGQGGEGGGEGGALPPHRLAWAAQLGSVHTLGVQGRWCISPAPPSPPWCRAAGNISPPGNISVDKIIKNKQDSRSLQCRRL